jgi:hypothetical protein
MWEKVFQRYCGYDGALRKRTVAQILKEAYEFQDASLNPPDGGVVCDEEWIVDIPDLDLLELL